MTNPEISNDTDNKSEVDNNSDSSEDDSVEIIDTDTENEPDIENNSDDKKKSLCIDITSILLIAKTLGNQIISMDNDIKNKSYETIVNFIKEIQKDKRLVINDALQMKFYGNFAYTLTFNICEHFLLYNIELCDLYFHIFNHAIKKHELLKQNDYNMMYVCMFGTEISIVLKKMLDERPLENKNDYKFSESFIYVVNVMTKNDENTNPPNSDIIAKNLASLMSKAICSATNVVSNDLEPSEKINNNFDKKKDFLFNRLIQFLSFYP